MKRTIVVLVSAAFISSAVSIMLTASTIAGSRASSEYLQSQPRKKRVAILDFDYGTVRSSSAALFGSDVDVGRGISDLLVRELVKDGTYSVIERQALDRILAEQNFSNSDRANPATAARVGKLLGVDAIIVGSITQFGHDTQNTRIGGAGRGVGGFGIGGVGRKKTKAIVAVDARIVDIDTGEIRVVAHGKGESKRESTSLLGGGGRWRGFGVGAVDFSSSDFRETIIGEAVHNAVGKLSSDVISGSGRVEARKIRVEGLVASVEGSQLILNVGARAGLKVGDRLSIERVTREIKDPATGKLLRRVASPLGTVEVIDVDDVSSVARIVSGAGFRVGDLAKTVTQ